MEGWRGGLGNDATLETPTVVDSSVHSRWVWDSTPKCADSSGKQSDGLPRKKNVPASSSPIDNALQKLHRLAGAWPLRRTRARWWSSDAPCGTPPCDSRVSEPSLGTHRVGRSSARAARGFISGGKFLNSPRSSARGVSLHPTGFRASPAPREDALAAFARHVHTKQKGAFVT